MSARRMPAVDGVRAMACLAVVAVHAHVRGADAGWLGVDVFFVLSGWLITRLLLAEGEMSGRIALTSFYLRRAGRLYPALVVVALAALGQAFAGDGSLTAARMSVGLALTYTLDLSMWATRAGAGPLTHTWSLAVEEQFYLCWPVLMTWVRGRRRLALITGLLAAVSLSVMAGSAGRIAGVPAGYFLPPARIWEPLAGGLLALLGPGRLPARARARCGWAGVVLLAADAATAGSSTTASERGMTAAVLLAVAGALLLITACLQGTGAVVRVLSCRALVWTGRRSYAIYLWHPLILVPLAPVSRWTAVPVALVVTLLAADLSYRWVEMPARRWVGRVVGPAPDPAAGQACTGPVDSQPVPRLRRA